MGMKLYEPLRRKKIKTLLPELLETNTDNQLGYPFRYQNPNYALNLLKKTVETSPKL